MIVLADGSGARGPATVNQYLAGVFGFYDHHARTGLRVAAELVSWRRVPQARGTLVKLPVAGALRCCEAPKILGRN